MFQFQGQEGLRGLQTPLTLEDQCSNPMEVGEVVWGDIFGCLGQAGQQTLLVLAWEDRSSLEKKEVA